MVFKKEDRFKKILILFAAFVLVLMTGYQIIFPVLDTLSEKKEKDSSLDIIFTDDKKDEINKFDNLPIPSTIITEEKKQVEEIKKEVLLSVPFTSQAPLGVWDELYNEACEEASLIMADAFLQNKKLNKSLVAQEIKSMVDWQINKWGSHKDLTLEEVKELAIDYYNYEKIRIETDITLENIKEELSQGNPVILPLAGRYVNNQHYRTPGPYYHMLVVIGYKEDQFITNDPGTKRGEKYVYDKDSLFRAVHDWPGEDRNILDGQKAMLIIEKK